MILAFSTRTIMKDLEIVSFSLSKQQQHKHNVLLNNGDSRLSTSEQGRRRNESRDSKSRCVSNVLLRVFTIDDATYSAHDDAIRHRRLLTTTPADTSGVAGYRSNSSSRQVRFRIRPDNVTAKPNTVDDDVFVESPRLVLGNDVVSDAVATHSNKPTIENDIQGHQTSRSSRGKQGQGWLTLVQQRRSLPDSLEDVSCLEYLGVRGCQLKETRAASRHDNRAHTAPLRRHADLSRALRQLTLERAEQRRRARTAR